MFLLQLVSLTNQQFTLYVLFLPGCILCLFNNFSIHCTQFLFYVMLGGFIVTKSLCKSLFYCGWMKLFVDYLSFAGCTTNCTGTKIIQFPFRGSKVVDLLNDQHLHGQLWSIPSLFHDKLFTLKWMNYICSW